MVVLLIVVAVVAGALLVAVLPGRDGAGGIALASPSPSDTPIPTPTPRPTLPPTAVPTATKEPKPTPVPKPTPKPPGGGAADLCEPFLGIACGLDPGTYDPSRFAPPIRIQLGEGWSVSVSEAGLIALTRDEGTLTFASGITVVYPAGDAARAPGSARALVETFIETDGVAAGKPDDQHVDKRKATIVDLVPTGPDRVPLFGSGTQTFYLEAYGTTRIVVIDGRDGPLVIAVEPAGDSTLDAVLLAAMPVVQSLSFR